MQCENGNVQNEEWKEIPGYGGNYAASNMGRIKRTRSTRYVKAGNMLNVHTDEYGYCRVRLRSGKPARPRIHRLVLAAFVGPCPEGQQCRHLDGNKQNNHLSNLAYGTAVENGRDAIRHDTIAHGERCGKSKLAPSQVREIVNMVKSGSTRKAVASIYNIGITTVSAIIEGRSWRRITGISR